MTPAQRKSAVTLIGKAYSALDPLNDIKMTAYRDQCYALALAEERQHRRHSQFQWGLTLATAARLFVVKRIAEHMLTQRRTTIADVLTYQASAIYAASIVANYRTTITTLWAGFDIAELAELDYAALVEV